MKYLAVFVWHGDGMGSSSTWSTEVDTTDKDAVIDALVKKGHHHRAALDDAEILVIQNGSVKGGTDVRALKSHSAVHGMLEAPKVIHHWSALNGDFG